MKFVFFGRANLQIIAYFRNNDSKGFDSVDCGYDCGGRGRAIGFSCHRFSAHVSPASIVRDILQRASFTLFSAVVLFHRHLLLLVVFTSGRRGILQPLFDSDHLQSPGPHPLSSEKTSELLKALLTGRKEGLDSSTVTAFRSSGASHILALSGLHLGVLYIVISKPLAILGNTVPAYRIRCCSTILISGIYVLATGAGPSIVRAFLFILLNEISKLHPERKKDGILVFWTAITVQAVLDPPVIRSVSFQLSYLAVLGILLFYPALKGFYPEGGGRWSIMRRIWNSASLSISCQILTAPLAFHYFGTFPKYFLITNLIALPLTEVLIAGGTLCAVLALAGCCPAALARPVETVASLLVNSLETISGM